MKDKNRHGKVGPRYLQCCEFCNVRTRRTNGWRSHSVTDRHRANRVDEDNRGNEEDQRMWKEQ